MLKIETRIDKSSFDKAKTDLKNAQIATIFAVNQMAQALMNGTSTRRNQPDIQESHGQG